MCSWERVSHAPLYVDPAGQASRRVRLSTCSHSPPRSSDWRKRSTTSGAPLLGPGSRRIDAAIRQVEQGLVRWPRARRSSIVGALRRHQSGKPRARHRRRATSARAERLYLVQVRNEADVTAALIDSPQSETPMPPARWIVQSASAPDAQTGRRRRPLARSQSVRQAALHADALRTGSRISHPSALQPRRRPARSHGQLQRGQGKPGHPASATMRRSCSNAFRRGRCHRSRPPAQDGQPHHRVLRHS